MRHLPTTRGSGRFRYIGELARIKIFDLPTFKRLKTASVPPRDRTFRAARDNVGSNAVAVSTSTTKRRASEIAQHKLLTIASPDSTDDEVDAN